MFMKKLIYSLLPALLLTACINGDKYHSEVDAGILIEHSKTARDSENKPELILEQGKVIKIRKVANGIYYVMSDFFTDEAGYFVLTGKALPEISGKFTKIKDNVFSFEIRG